MKKVKVSKAGWDCKKYGHLAWHYFDFAMRCCACGVPLG